MFVYKLANALFPLLFCFLIWFALCRHFTMPFSLLAVSIEPLITVFLRVFYLFMFVTLFSYSEFSFGWSTWSLNFTFLLKQRPCARLFAYFDVCEHLYFMHIVFWRRSNGKPWKIWMHERNDNEYTAAELMLHNNTWAWAEIETESDVRLWALKRDSFLKCYCFFV